MACARDVLQNLKLLHGASGIWGNLNEIQILGIFGKVKPGHIELIVDSLIQFLPLPNA